METVHATCVAIGGQGVLLRGPSGSGKSDLALRLIDAGATLVGDDYCVYKVRAGEVIAAPRAGIRGKLEVRGLGIVTVGAADEAPVRLVVDLMPGRTPDRLPERRTTDVRGVAVPCIALDPFEASAAAKVRLAVRIATGDISAEP